MQKGELWKEKYDGNIVYNRPFPQIEHPNLEMILTKEIENFQTLIVEEWSFSNIEHNICEESL